MALNIFKKIKIKKYQVQPIPDSVWKNPLHFIAFGFGSGTLPIAPGTFGTLVGVLFYLLLQPLNPNYYLVIVVIITIASSWICDKVSKEINIEDHQGMCLDEIVGFLVTMLYVPAQWSWIILGFILFRVFDILKPWPIRYLDETVKGGFGMILDDVVAGIFSCIVLHILMRIFP